MCRMYGDFVYQTEEYSYLAVKALPEHNADFTKAATMTLTSARLVCLKRWCIMCLLHLANTEGVCALMNFGKEQSWLLSLPLYHVSGKVSCGAGFMQVPP